MKRIAFAIMAATSCAHPPKPPAPQPPAPPPPISKSIYSGVYTESSRESIFYPCGSTAGNSGWWLRFLPGAKADRARYQYDGPGMPNSTHFIVVRGTLSPPGFFGYGFQFRQLEVDSVLEIRDPQGCPNAYNSAPRRWESIGFVGRMVSAVASTQDARLTAIAVNKGTVTVWDNASGKKITEYRFMPPYHPSTIPSLSMAFSRSGRMLAIGGVDGWVQVVRIPSGKRIWKLAHSTHEDTIGTPGKPGRAIYGASDVRSVAFTADEKTLVSAGGGRAYTWSMSSGKRINKLLGTGINRDVAPSHVLTTADPPRIIGYSSNGSLNVYSAAGGVPLFTAAGPKAGSRAGPIKISADERFIAIGESGESVSLWSMTEGKIIHRFEVPPFGSGDFALSPDGEKLAMPGGTFSVYVWNTTSGAPVAQLRASHAGAFRLWFTPNGDSVVMSTFFDSTLVVSAMPTRSGATRDLIFAAARNPSNKTAFLFGAVTDSLAPLVGAMVEIAGDSLHPRSLRRTQSDIDGLFTIDSLPPSPAYMRVRRIGYSMFARQLELVAGVNSVRIPMQRDPFRLSSLR
jgi:WD40 repeat protein